MPIVVVKVIASTSCISLEEFIYMALMLQLLSYSATRLCRTGRTYRTHSMFSDLMELHFENGANIYLRLRMGECVL